MAIISQQPVLQSILFSWLPFLPRFMGSDQSTGQRYEIVLNQLEQTSGRYIESLPGPIDWQHSFITDTGSNHISLSANTPRADTDTLQALTFVEIITAPDFDKNNEDQQFPSLPLSDTELKKALGQGELLSGGGGGGDFSFRPDHRPGGGGGGAQTDNELWLSMSPSLSLRGLTRKLEIDGESTRVRVPLKPPEQKSLIVQTLSASGVRREQHFSAEQLTGLLAGDQPLTPEQEDYARQLVHDALRIQVYGDAVPALKHLVPVEPDTSTGCYSGQIPGMISCPLPREGSGGGTSSSNSRANSGDTGGGYGYYSGSSGFSGKSGSSGGFGASGGDGDDGDDPRKPRGWGGGYLESDEEGEEEIRQQQSQALPFDQAMAQTARAAKLHKHQQECTRWNSSGYSRLINWALIYGYLPNDINIVKFLEIITNPGPSTYEDIVKLIMNTRLVRQADESARELVAYEYLRQGLEACISDRASSPLPLVQGTVKILKAFIDGARGLPPNFISVKPVGRDKAGWEELQQLAEMVFWDIPPDSPVQLTVTDGLEREVRRLIYAVLYDISDEMHNDKGILQGTAMGHKRITISELTTKIQSESDTRKHLTLLALAMQESSEFFQEKITESAKTRKKTKTLEKNILPKIKGHLSAVFCSTTNMAQKWIYMKVMEGGELKT